MELIQLLLKLLINMRKENIFLEVPFYFKQLENMVSIQDFSGMESRYKMLLEKCLSVIENNTLALQKISAGEEENQAPSDWR